MMFGDAEHDVAPPTHRSNLIHHLCAGLAMIGHGYQIEKAISRTARTDTELKKDLSRFHEASRTVADVLDADLSGSCQIEVILSDLWRGSRVPRLAEDLQSLSEGSAILLVMAAQNGAIKKRQQDPETWFFLAAHDLFSEITGDPEPGIAGPLHRFTKSCAALIDAGIAVPERENFLAKATHPSSGSENRKISVLPKVVFPGK
jgi:hypothetical protein